MTGGPAASGRPAPPAPPARESRLTLGWRQAHRPASLREHRLRYGPAPADARGLIDTVAAAGLTGRGGAGFPTGVKMRSVAARRGPAALVANGMESEPASEKDQALLAMAPHLVLDGAALTAAAIGADRVHLCLGADRAQQVGGVLAAIAERDRAGLNEAPFLVHTPPAGYVSSQETALIDWLNGGEARPAVTPPRPFERGVGRLPTLVCNVETLAHVALIARFGAAWFTEAGLAGAAGTMLVTVSGAVARPGVYEIAAGTAVRDALAAAGVTGEGGAVLIGGYGGTWHALRAVGGLPLSASGLRPAGGSPGAGVLVALPAGRCGVAETARVLDYLARQSARQCGPCMFGLPAIAADFAQLAAGRPAGDVLARLDRRIGVIAGRGACHHPDGATRLAASALDAFASDVRAHAAGASCRPAGYGERPVLPVPEGARA